MADGSTVEAKAKVGRSHFSWWLSEPVVTVSDQA